MPQLDLVCPGARIHCQADTLRGLERVVRQGLQRQGGACRPKGGGHRMDQPIFEDTDTPNTAVGKPAPARQQGTDVTGERDVLQEITSCPDECLPC